MYLCKNCGSSGERPGRKYEDDCVSADVCRSCGSTGLLISTVSCSVCGEPLFEGDSAYEVKDMIICLSCATEITV